MAAKLAISFVLLALSFLLSAAEVALYSVASSKENLKGKSSLRVIKSEQTLLSTILVSNAVTVFLFTLYGASIALDISTTLAINRTVSVLLEIIVVTTVLIFFADAVPKLVAAGNPKLIVNICMPLLTLLAIIESPIIIPLNSLLSKITAGRKKTQLTIDNAGLRQLSKVAGTAGIIDAHEADLLKKIAFLGEKTVKDAMTLRTQITGIMVGSNFDDVVATFRKSEHSRIPVYSESLDNVLGMLYARDFLPLLRRKGTRRKFDVTKLMRQPVFVPETQSLERLLETFKSSKVHIAVVVDEFGGLAGIITLSDVVREIFGSSAEMPREDVILANLPDNVYVVKGAARLDEIADAIGGPGFDFKTGDTVSALIVGVHGSVPRVGTKIMIGNYEFEVVQATPKTVLQVRLRLLYSPSVSKDG